MRKSLFLCSLLIPILAFAGAARADDPPAIRLDRLERLAAHLDTVSPDRFDMGRWGNGEDSRSETFSGCAAGHGVALFESEGLRLEAMTPGADLAFGDRRGVFACAAFFGLSDEDAWLLFSSHRGRTVAEEIALIRRVISTEQRALARAAPVRCELASAW